MAYQDAGSRRSSVKTMLVLVAIATVIVVAVLYFYLRPKDVEQLPLGPLTSQSVELTPETVYQAPVPQAVYEAPKPVATAEALPSLNESDTKVLSALQSLSAQTLKYAVPNEIIRKFVRAVNAIEEGKVVHEYRPIVSPAPAFIAEGMGEVTGNEPQQLRLSSKNFQRYDSYVTLLAMLDTDQIVAVYQHFYPLLEEAYAEMGVKKGNFHSVFIGAIDNLLAAPTIEEDIVLVRPKIFYQYADSALEKLPASHRLLLRMGPDNTRSVQESLRKLREQLAE